MPAISPIGTSRVALSNTFSVQQSRVQRRTAARERHFKSVAAEQMRTRMRSLSRDLKAYKAELSGTRLQAGARAAEVASTVKLHVGEATHTTLRSTQPLVAKRKHITQAPAWTGDSTASVSVAGDYSGDAPEHLHFQVQAEATGRRGKPKPSRDIRLRVFDGDGAHIDTVKIDKRSRTGRSRETGLEISLGKGSALAGDSFGVEVTRFAGTVDPDAPINSSEHDNGGRVRNGSFRVNGVRIKVRDSDSISEVLGRINSSDAAVDATFDGESGRVELTSRQSGAVALDVGRDSSGFLSAVGLRRAEADLGRDGAGRLVDNDVLAEVRRGKITVNDVSIRIDPRRDAVTDVVERINAADAGVRAAVSSDGRLSLTSLDRREAMVLRDDTGLLDALNIAVGRHDPGEGDPTLSWTAARSLSRGLADLATPLNEIFSDVEREESASWELRDARSMVRGAILRSMAVDEDAGAALGLSFQFSSTEPGQALDLEAADARGLADGMRDDPERFMTLMLGDETGEGLLDATIDALQGAMRGLRSPGRTSTFGTFA